LTTETVATTLELQAVHGELVEALHAQGYELPSLGVGVSSGEASTGEFSH